MASHVFAQQSRSFAEYWFGVKPQNSVQKSTKSSAKKAPVKAGLRSSTGNPSGIFTLDLSQPTNPATFDVDANGVWTGTYSNDYPYIEFNNSTFMLSHVIDGDGFGDGSGGSWDGFTYSKNGDNTDYYGGGSSQSWTTHQWGNMAGGGIKTDADGNVLKDENGVVTADPDTPYLVAYWGYYKKEGPYADMFPDAQQTLQIILNKVYNAKGVYINNSPWPYYGNISGDGFARPLDQDGDYFKLIIYGLDENYEDNGKQVEYYLAQNIGGTLIQSPNWEWVDLSALGEIGGMYFRMESSAGDPMYGMNTAGYFCMDKLQVEDPLLREVTITMNTVSTTMGLKNKETGEPVNTGTPTSNKYTFKAYPGDYVLSAYGTDGTTLNGTIELTVTDDATQQFQFYTITAYATNSNWTLGTDYTINATAASKDAVPRTITLGSSVTAGRATFLACSGDSYYAQLIPNASRQGEGYLATNVSGTITANVTASKAVPMGYTYTVTAPAEATVYVGFPDYSGYYFRPFTEITAVDVTSEGENKVYTYTIAGGQACIYRISQPDKVTYASVFTKASSNDGITITPEMLDGNPKTIDHDVSHNSGYNVSDIYLNINEKGYLKLASGDTYQIVNIRAWQTNNSVTANLFIEPDFHYTVINENGTIDNSVVTVNNKGLLTAVGNGTAIVLVTYDAVNVASALGGPFFSAVWPENTGVFVVSVGATESGITPNMTINETLANANKNAGINVDAELDVFYYLEDKGGFDYTFTPTGVTSVSLAQPVVGTNMTTYNGFSTDGVMNNGDGSYTVHLTQGRNIVKLTSAAGTAYQILTAKPVTYTVTNASREGEKIQPGDKVSIRFNTLYHPNTKLAGVYNMQAFLQYTAEGSVVRGTGNQYTFAGTANAQTVSATIPADWDIENDFTFTGGVLRSYGFGDPFGNHRLITLENGRNANFTAVLCEGYFGALPDISIKLTNATDITTISTESEFNIYPNPFVDHINIKTGTDSHLTIYNISGQCVLNTMVQAGETRIETSAFPKGSYVVKCGEKTMKIVK